MPRFNHLYNIKVQYIMVSTLMFRYDEEKTAGHVYSLGSRGETAAFLHQAFVLHPYMGKNWYLKQVLVTSFI